MCKGDVENGFSTFTSNRKDCTIIVKNVPSRICTQCGAASYATETARKLEQIIASASQSVNTEIAVLTFAEKVA